MTGARPDPDALLAQVQAEEAAGRRKLLKIFFGYAAGVGKTYAMLAAARRARDDGRAVLVGYVEPHGRVETEALLDGLDALPNLAVEHRGVTLREFDVDAALARPPALILVDELAHTNAPGCRHAKRWQDVEELLDAGFEVWTTLNVQHIDSLNDVVGRVTGVTVRETVPDRIFDLAAELELVDIAPQELVDRLRAGKVYGAEQAERAARSFFQPTNLMALREFALRHAARRVQTDVESARRARSVSEPWPTAERLLVCVGPSPTTARVIRTARRMAAALDAPWLAVAVEPIGGAGLPSAREQVAKHFRLAERLGAETVTLAGSDVAETVLAYARERNVTKVFIGKTRLAGWRRLARRTVVDTVLDQSGDIDVYVIQGREDAGSRPAGTSARPRPGDGWRPYLLTAAVLAVASLLAAGCARLGPGEANQVMVYLAAVALVAYRAGRWQAGVASLAAVLIFDFLFVPPVYTFAVTDTRYLPTFGVMLVIGLGIGTLTAQLRAQVAASRLREARTRALYQLGKQLSSVSGGVFLAAAAGRSVVELTGGEVAIYLGRGDDPPEVAFGAKSSIAGHPVSMPTARWVIDHDQVAGMGTDTLPNAAALFLPLTASQGTVGAIAIRAAEVSRLLDPDERRLLEACSAQLALALERDRLSLAASAAQVKAEAEEVRNALLSSVSHDLRTPLAVIAGASSSLLRSPTFDADTRGQLLQTIADEADRLHRLLENILQMSRLELGESAAHKQWHLLEEIIGSACARTGATLAGRDVRVDLAPDLPLVLVDGLLLEQVFVNLFENAARHTPAGTPIRVDARLDGRRLRVVVADRGPGFPPGVAERVFEKFYRGPGLAGRDHGSGLGLAICRAVAAAHGGTIVAANRPGGGAEFILTLPAPEPPTVDLSEPTPPQPDPEATQP